VSAKKDVTIKSYIDKISKFIRLRVKLTIFIKKINIFNMFAFLQQLIIEDCDT